MGGLRKNVPRGTQPAVRARWRANTPFFCPFSQDPEGLSIPFSGEKGKMVANPRHRASDLCAGKRLISLSEAMFRARFPLERGKPARNRPLRKIRASGSMDWLSAVSPPRLPPLRWCLLPSYVSRDTSALAVFTRCAREASLRRYAAVAGHVPGTPSGRGTFPWSTFRAHGPAHLANAG